MLHHVDETGEAPGAKGDGEDAKQARNAALLIKIKFGAADGAI